MALAKGITTRAADFAPFGIRSKPIGLIWYTIRERRLIELFVSLFYVLQSAIAAKRVASRETGVGSYDEVFQHYALAGGGRLVARRNSVVERADRLIAGEYGQPGARILYRTAAAEMLFDPYANDAGVWHIHAILPLADGRFLVATGDRKKYLDLMEIDAAGCRIHKRIERLCAGYTGMARHGDDIWAGSDFSERANFIKKVGGSRKHFLPAACAKNYVIGIDSVDRSHLLVITRRLNSYAGYALLFDTIGQSFVAGNPIAIGEWTAL